MFVVDTNVLLYAADADAPEHDVCRRQLERWRRSSSPWYVTWGILYEFLRVATHPRVFRKPWGSRQAMRFVEALLAGSAVGILAETPRHAAVLEEVEAEVPRLVGNLFHDAHTAVLMREHGVRRIVTRDADFHRFGFLEVLDPLA